MQGVETVCMGGLCGILLFGTSIDKDGTDMAFNILSSDEIELLTDNQRKSYEKELAIYNERVEFVEQMERFENMVILPYEPEFPPISDISQIPKKEFVKPEYEMLEIVPIEKPEHMETAVRFAKLDAVDVPKYGEMKSVTVWHLKKVEQEEPALPRIIKTTVPNHSFAKGGQQQPILPASIKISIPGNTFKKFEQASPSLPSKENTQNLARSLFEPVTMDASAIMADIPGGAVPAVEIPTFAVAPRASVTKSLSLANPVMPRLPQMPDRMPSNIPFCAPDIQQMELPGVPKATIPSTRLMKTDAATEVAVPGHRMPEVPKLAVKFSEINIAKIVEAEVPETPKVFDVPIIQASTLEPIIQGKGLPMVQKAGIPAKEFRKGEYAVSGLPKVVAPKPSMPLFFGPKHQEPMFPQIMKPGMVPKGNHKLAVDSTPRIERPSINIFFVEPYKKIHTEARGLPTVQAVDVPDVCTEEMLEILLPSLEKDGIGKGALG